MKRVLNSAAVQAAIVWAGYLYLVLVARTTRWEVQGRDHLDSFASGRPCIVAFWHETLPAMPILFPFWDYIRPVKVSPSVGEDVGAPTTVSMSWLFA